MKVHVVNLEYGMPTVEQARIRLEQALRTARSQKYSVLKLIHGYGSTGKGGKIKQDVQIFLSEQKEKGNIKEYVCGDSFSPFNEATRNILKLYPKIYKDKDYSKGNAGITIVIM